MRPSLLKIHREERCLAIVITILIASLNAAVVIHYWDAFTRTNIYIWTTFIRGFKLSGFDPISYAVISNWHSGFYNVFRHPLLEFFMLPLTLLNQCLIAITGTNCAIIIMAVLQTLMTLYGALFMRRLCRHALRLSAADSTLMALLLYGLAYVMMAAVTPDHFNISLTLLLGAIVWTMQRGLWSSADKGRHLWLWIVLFIVIAGVSLNNGLKVYLLALVIMGWRRFFHWKHLLLACALPAAMLWCGARLQYSYIVAPHEKARKEAKAAHDKKVRERKLKQQKEAQKTASLEGDKQQPTLTSTTNADVKPVATPDATPATAEAKTTNADVKSTVSPSDSASTAKPAAKPKKKKRKVQGKPFVQGEFMRWSDAETSRLDAAVHNLFGEGVQLHEDYLLCDVMRSRPIVVRYQHWWQYAVEGLLVALMLSPAVLWAAHLPRRRRPTPPLTAPLMTVTVGWFLIDMALHMGLGFAINEVYIMSAHWMYVIPLCIGCLLQRVPCNALRAVVALLTLYLWAWNGGELLYYLYTT